MIVRTCASVSASGADCSECDDGWAGPHCATRVTVRITAAPLPVTTTKEGVFTFSSNGTVTFECALDDADFALCATPKSVQVNVGAHRMRVRGQTSGGYQTKVQSYLWYVSSFGDEAIVTSEASRIMRYMLLILMAMVTWIYSLPQLTMIR